MSKMTREELQKRKLKLKQIVHADIVKREVMQFRLEPENIDKLYQLAAKKRKPAGTLVREWITERINAELGRAKGKVAGNNTTFVPGTFDLAIDRLKAELQKPLEEISKRMSIMEDIAHRLERHL